MKKQAIHAFASILTVLFVLSTSLCALAAGDNYEIEPMRYTTISDIVLYCDIFTSGRAECSASARIRTGNSGVLTMNLQRSSNGYAWTTIKSWNTSGSGKLSVEGSHYVTSGYTYRIEVSIQAKNASGQIIETETRYSSGNDY